MTEYQLRQKYVDILRSWVGLNEADKSHRKIIDIYNSQTEIPRNYRMTLSDAWCAATVSAAAIECGIVDIIPPECSCTRMIEKLKNIGAWEENDGYVPSPGDLIFYDWQDSGKGDNGGLPDHVGVVESLVAQSFVAIEGNYHNAVGRRKMAVNGRFIRGFGVPDFRGKAELLSRLSAAVTDGKTPVTVAAQEVIDGRWSNGDLRKQRLTEAGYTADEVERIQGIVNALLAGVWTVQVCVNSFLYIRSKPDKTSGSTGTLSNGEIVRVTEIQPGTGSASGWGKLSDGTGWIALDYTVPVTGF